MTNRVNVEDLIAELSRQFANALFQAMSQSSLEEIIAEMEDGTASATRAATKAPLKRPSSKSAVEPERLQATLVAKLRATPTGLRAEQLREALGVDKVVVTRGLRDALGAGSIRKAGQKRATTYFAVG
ncbi:hypothetical protein EON82_23975 [bacterium]|nr:MAG: hypothetical protein EON82_23975 [bacterium]